MKKIISMALVLIMLVCSVATLTACGIPADYNDAKANLEDEGYKVTVDTTALTINLMLSVFGVEDAKADAVLNGEKDDEGIILIYCEDKDSAAAIVEKLEAFIEEAKEEIDQMFDDKDSEEYKEAIAEFEVEIGKDGKVVYMATKQALKDVK